MEKIFNETYSPKEQILHLVNIKRKNIVAAFKGFEQHAEILAETGMDIDYIGRPVNPLLLVSALSIYKIQGEDYRSQISLYLNGLALPIFEKYLIKLDLDEFIDYKKLTDIFDLEDSYVDALIEIGLDELTNKYHPSILLDSNREPTLWHAYFAAWRAINPLYDLDFVMDIIFEKITSEKLQEVILKSIDLGAFFYGVDRYLYSYNNIANDIIHNTLQYYDYEINNCYSKINECLKNKGPQDSNNLEKMLTKYEILKRLHRRAFRLYEWIPDEISAFAAETASALANHHPDEIKKSKYSKYILSDSLKNRIKEASK